MHFEKQFRDWTVSLSRNRRWIWSYIAGFAIVAGVSLGVSSFRDAAGDVAWLGWISLGMAIFLGAWHVFDKRRWFQRVEKVIDCEACYEIRFDDEGVQTKSPTMQASIAWGGFDEVVQGEEGLFLRQATATKTHIYVPYAALSRPGAGAEIAAAFRAAQEPSGSARQAKRRVQQRG